MIRNEEQTQQLWVYNYDRFFIINVSLIDFRFIRASNICHGNKILSPEAKIVTGFFHKNYWVFIS